MYIFLFICTLLVPLTMIILGGSYMKNPPKEIKGSSGYRTSMSTLNKDTWTYAHHYVGKIMFVLGSATTILTIIVMVVIKSHSDFEMIVIYLTFIQMGIMACTIVPTERRLHKVFDREGHRK